MFLTHLQKMRNFLGTSRCSLDGSTLAIVACMNYPSYRRIFRLSFASYFGMFKSEQKAN